MKTRFVSCLTNLAAVLFLAVSPIVTTAHAAKKGSRNEPVTTLISVATQPAACKVVYPTKENAYESCPPGAKVFEWREFWESSKFGWACDCSTIEEEPELPALSSDETI